MSGWVEVSWGSWMRSYGEGWSIQVGVMVKGSLCKPAGISRERESGSSDAAFHANLRALPRMTDSTEKTRKLFFRFSRRCWPPKSCGDHKLLGGARAKTPHIVVLTARSGHPHSDLPGATGFSGRLQLCDRHAGFADDRSFTKKRPGEQPKSRFTHRTLPALSPSRDPSSQNPPNPKPQKRSGAETVLTLNPNGSLI